MLLYLSVIAVVALVGASVYLLRLRRSDWLRFADRHDLGVVTDTELGAPTLRGTIRGHSVLLRSGSQSSDTGALGVEVLSARVGLDHDLPEGLEVSAKSMVSGLEPAREGEVLDFDDEEFVATARVRADDAESAHAYLTAHRRRAIIDVFAATDTPDVGIVADDAVLGSAAVVARWREASSDLEHLEKRISALVRCAEQLDED